jgi:hypothetical protein
MYQSEKHLCGVGKSLESDWSQAVENYKKGKTETNKEKAYKTAYLYFTHRRECSFCTVIWEKK